MIYYSEYGEDKWIEENLPLPETGVYVDIGCNHPVIFSNTAFLRDRGWTGAGIDADECYRAQWGSNFLKAVISVHPFVKFKFGGPCARISEEGVDVPAIKIEEALEMIGIQKIDLLSIDIEGGEFDAMKDFDFDKHGFPVIIAEYNTLGIGEDYRLRDFLVSLGYTPAHKTISSFIYFK